MRVAFICNSYSNIFRGGAEVQLDNTINSLRDKGVVVDIVSYESTYSLADYDLVHFFRVEQSFNDVGDYLISINKPYVVSTIMYPDTKWRYFYYRMGSFFANYALGKIFTISEKIRFLRNASALYPNTLEEAKILRKLSRNSKIEVIPNCAEEEFFNGGSISAELFQNRFPGLQYPFVLNVGRIEPRKNQLRLVLACNMLNIGLVIIGSVRDKEYWDSCLKLAAVPIYHIDKVSCKDVLISAYKSCEVFALPSTMETPGLVAIEAALQGAKIVITSRGGTTEYFGEKTVFVNPYSTISIKKGIMAQLGNHKIKNASVNMGFYRYFDIADRYIASYEAVIRGIRA